MARPKTYCRLCPRRALALSLCKEHYVVARRDPALSKALGIPKCNIDGCETMAETAGSCRKHYSQMRRGEILTNEDWRYLDRACPIPSCDRTMKGIAKVCVKHQKIRWRYSLSVEEMIELYSRGKCDICDATDRQLVIDHNHSCCPVEFGTCGRCNRGIVCAQCNRAMGIVGDSTAILERMVDYLRR